MEEDDDDDDDLLCTGRSSSVSSLAFSGFRELIEIAKQWARRSV
jgi:hypothetical protein